MSIIKQITAVACLMALVAIAGIIPAKSNAQKAQNVVTSQPKHSDLKDQPNHKSRIKNIVLVHGAFADGSSWVKTIAILQTHGYHVIAVQNPLTSLEQDVAATKRAIALMDGPVLLVGHSYGGVVITEAGNDPKVAALVYVCALIPDVNESVADITKKDPNAPGSAEIKPDAAGYLSLTYKGIHSFFAQDLPTRERDVLYATQTPWATVATTKKVARPAWKTKPSWCIIGLKDHMVTPALARAEAKMLHAKSIELETSHVPMLSRPKQVANFIMEATKQ